jgi:hypothetical protein
LSALTHLAGVLGGGGGLLAAELDRDGGQATQPGPASVAAAGPRAAGGPEEYELVVEAIYEGYRQHYGAPRLMREADPDLSLLAGDRLYALGLERLVALGDVPAVVELADVISLCALAHARGEGDLAGPVWEAGARAVGWGPTAAYTRAKALVLVGDERGTASLRAEIVGPTGPPGEPGR